MAGATRWASTAPSSAKGNDPVRSRHGVRKPSLLCWPGATRLSIWTRRGFDSRRRHSCNHSLVAQLAERPAVNRLIQVRVLVGEHSEYGLAGQWSGRHPVKVEIAGSSPVKTAVRVAQLAERSPDMREAARSNRAVTTKPL